MVSLAKNQPCPGLGLDRFLHCAHGTPARPLRPCRARPPPPARHPLQCHRASHRYLDRPQIVDAFPDDSASSYLVRDRDQVYGQEFRHRVKGCGSAKSSRRRTASGNPLAERFVASRSPPSRRPPGPATSGWRVRGRRWVTGSRMPPRRELKTRLGADGAIVARDNHAHERRRGRLEGEDLREHRRQWPGVRVGDETSQGRGAAKGGVVVGQEIESHDIGGVICA
jgi:hypothetical protein